MANWYAANSQPNQESRLYKSLKRNGFEAIDPMVPLVGSTVEQPYYPGYVLFQADSDSVHLAKKVKGIRKIVGIDGIPIPIPNTEAESTREKLELIRENGYVDTIVKSGSHVSITDGFLEDMVGVVDRIDGDSAIVDFYFWGKKTSKRVYLTSVEITGNRP